MTTQFYFKACPKCGGDMHSEKDIYGAYLSCLQCGYDTEPKIYNPPPPEKEWNVHQDSTKKIAKEGHRKSAGYEIKDCSEEGCIESAYAKGMCVLHYKRSVKKLCSYEGCQSKDHIGGLCRYHLKQKQQGVLI